MAPAKSRVAAQARTSSRLRRVFSPSPSSLVTGSSRQGRLGFKLPLDLIVVTQDNNIISQVFGHLAGAQHREVLIDTCCFGTEKLVAMQLDEDSPLVLTVPKAATQSVQQALRGFEHCILAIHTTVNRCFAL